MTVDANPPLGGGSTFDFITYFTAEAFSTSANPSAKEIYVGSGEGEREREGRTTCTD